jgi:hypothetical protein
LTNEELEEFLFQMGINEVDDQIKSDLQD